MRLFASAPTRRNWERHEMRKLAELRAERAAEMFAMRRVQRTIAESMIGACKRNDAGLSGRKQRRLERGLDGFKTGVAENRFGVKP